MRKGNNKMPNHYEGFGEVTNPDGSPWYPEHTRTIDNYRRPGSRPPRREPIDPPSLGPRRQHPLQDPIQDRWPIEGQPEPQRVDPFEETARIEREMPHIQREVAFRDALNSLPGRAFDAGAGAGRSFVERLINILR